MRKDRKIARIRLLMVISQFLLAGFVIYWLTGRFQNEKELLYKDLLVKFRASEQKMLDSLILEKMLGPVVYRQERPSDTLHHKSMIRIEINSGDSLKMNPLHKEQDFAFNPKGPVSIIRKKSPNQDFRFIGTRDTLIQIKNSDDTLPVNREKIFLQGVKMLAEITDDSSTINRSFFFNFSKNMDTSILIKSFEEEISKKGLQAVWTRNKLSRNPFYLSSQVLNNDFGVIIEKYTLYLVRQLIPNLAFGFILLVSTGAAFIISFRSLKKQIALNLFRDELVSNMGHELKTPVSTVKVVLEAINNFHPGKNPEKIQEYIQLAQKEMERLEILIQKVLETSVYHKPEDFLHKEQAELVELVQHIIPTFEMKVKHKGGDIRFTYEAGNFDLSIDRVHIQGVIMNLIDNGLKYSTEKPLIDIDLKRGKEGIFLLVSDNGPGIPEEYHQKIFEKFFRVPQHNRHNVKGYGLGLHYAAHIMKHHNGSITVRNNPSGGCAFTLFFPQIQS